MNFLKAAISDLQKMVIENVSVEDLKILHTPENVYEEILKQIEKKNLKIMFYSVLILENKVLKC